MPSSARFVGSWLLLTPLIRPCGPPSPLWGEGFADQIKNQGVPWGTPWFFYAYSAVMTAFSPSDVAWMAEMGWR